MKRLWIGVILLLVFLAAGIVTTLSFHNIHTPMTQSLDQAADQAIAGQWESALGSAANARQRWEKYRNFGAMVADHEPLEEMDALFSQLDVYKQMNWQGEFAALCRQLARMTEALEESQALSWWTLF